MRHRDQIEISVVIPAYNEEKRLSSTLPHLWKGTQRRFDRFELIIVDDGSYDRTAEVVQAFEKDHPEVRLIRYGKNRGKGFAVRTGVMAAHGDVVLFSDADLSTPIRESRKLLAALDEGYDVAIGSRARRETRILKSQPIYRVLMGKTFNKIVRALAVRGINDTQCGFKCFPRSIAQQLFEQSRIEGFSFDVEILFIAQKMGLKIKEVGVLWRNSPESKVDPVWDSLRMLRELMVIRFHSLVGHYGSARPFSTRTET